MNTEFPQFLTIAELVQATKLSRQTVSRKISRNEIPHVRIGPRVLVPLSFLKDLESAAFSSLGQNKSEVSA